MNPSDQIPNKMKEIDDHIIKILTAGTYTTFTKAIREALSNSYDAGAQRVTINFDPNYWFLSEKNDALVIIIHDDGLGMSGDEFWEQFASIATPTKTPTKRDPITKRYPIGQFGIGAFALIPFVKEFIVFSKKSGKKPIMCRIKARNIMRTSGRSYKYHISENIDAIFISEEKWKEINSGSSDCGTIIRINGVSKEVFRQLKDGSTEFRRNKVKVFDDQGHLTEGLKEVAWDLSTIIPLAYEENDIYRTSKNYLKSPNEPVEVIFSGISLIRKIFSQEGAVTETFEYNKNGVIARGILVGNPGPVKPPMANGVMMRLNNVGIGGYQFFGFHIGQTMAQVRITGEIHILQGLNDELANNRETFMEFGENFSLINDALSKKLTSIARIAANLKSRTRTHAAKKEKERFTKKVKSIKRKKEEMEPEPEPETEPKPEEPEPEPETEPKPEEPEPEPETEPKPEEPEPEPETEPKPEEPEHEKKDPLIRIKDSGEVQIDPTHELFKLFKKKHETETIKFVLTALKLAEISDEDYFKIIDTLIDLKK